MKVCFVVLHAYSLFFKNTRHGFGGMEVRSYLIAIGIAQSTDIDVSFVVIDKGNTRQNVDNVQVYPHSGYVDFSMFDFCYAITAKLKRVFKQIDHRIGNYAAQHIRPKYTTKASLPFVSIQSRSPIIFAQVFLWLIYFNLFSKPVYKLRQWIKARRQKMSKRGLEGSSQRSEEQTDEELPPLVIEGYDYEVTYERYAIYDEIDADIYICFGVNEIGAELGRYCRERDKQYFLFIADDPDLQTAYHPGATGLNAYQQRNDLCYYSVFAADQVFVQTTVQQQRLREKFQKGGSIIRNPINLEQYSSIDIPLNERPFALWVGRSDRMKKMPERLIALASETPEINYTMIMNIWDQDVFRQIMKTCPSNVEIVEKVPYTEIEDYFARAFAFINTSDAEGFPNTFLQAGKYGVPLLSYKFDPDGIFEAHHCGIFAHEEFNRMVTGIRTLRNDVNQAQIYSWNIKQYVKQNHVLDTQVKTVVEAIYKGLKHQ